MHLQMLQEPALGDLRAFLQASGLPKDDLVLENSVFLVSRDGDGNIIASGGFETYGPYALLRSVAIAPLLRNMGFGVLIVGELLAQAKKKQVSKVYLLTETAEVFFAKLGFERVGREDAPSEIKASTEFSSVCPVSAVLMVSEI